MIRRTSSKEACVFCSIPVQNINAANPLAYAIRDANPVTLLHTLIVPRRHVPNYFDLHRAERNAIEDLLIGSRDEILSLDETIDGFNIGVNIGETAGQTIFHCHVHLIRKRCSGALVERDLPRG